MTCSFNDEKISAVVDELGMEGYGFWWRILEVVAEKTDESGEYSACFSAKKWGNFFGFSAKKFENFVRIFQKNKIFDVEFSENMVTVSIPNLLKYRDEWSRKKSRNSGETPEKLQSSRARVKDPDPDTDIKSDKDKSLSDFCAEPFSSSAPEPAPESVSAPPQEHVDDDPPVAFIPLPGDQGEFPVSRRLVEELQRAYPGVDVPGELNRARTWSLTNPTKRKTARGVPRFLNAWMEREQNRKSTGGGGFTLPDWVGRES